MTRKSFYITTPIYYANAKPHLGTLYSTVLADVRARFAALSGLSVRFLTGTDEHGSKIAQAAEKAGMEPQLFVDKAIDSFTQLFSRYDIGYTDFMRTTAPFHLQAVQEWITTLQTKGDIYKGAYEGWYCTPCETFVTIKDLQETGDSASSLHCPTCNREVQWVSEPCYFFKLSAYQKPLLDWYANNPHWITPSERMAEVVRFVQDGLKDLAISRSKQTVKWGVPFPGDPDQLVYVWADALNNYITAIGYGQPDRKDEYTIWWPADVQIMGKDIVRFHAIYWPAFLMAIEQSLPRQLIVHGWIKVGDQKMSKSLGNAVDPFVLADEYGSDAIRYYLTRYLAITHDAPFTIEDLQRRITSDLAHDWGNLLNRILVMAHKYGMVHLALQPDPRHPIVIKVFTTIQEVRTQLEQGMYHKAYAAVQALIATLNAFVHESQPWITVKTNKDSVYTDLSIICFGLHAAAVLLWPVTPQLAEKALHALSKTILPRLGYDYTAIFFEPVLHEYTLAPHCVLISPLIREAIAENQTNKSSTTIDITTSPSNQEGTLRMNNQAGVIADYQEISFDTFSSVVLAVGTILTVEDVAKSNKLYKLTVDLGAYGVRTILSGIKQSFTPDYLHGKQATFVVNLAPRNLMGIASHGMLLVTRDIAGTLQLLQPANPVPNGERIS